MKAGGGGVCMSPSGTQVCMPRPLQAAELGQDREPHLDRARESTHGEALPRSPVVPKLPQGPCKPRVNFSI